MSEAVPEWAMDSAQPQDDNAPKHVLNEAVLSAVAEFKNPTAYFLKHMPTSAEKKAFLQHLITEFPMQSDVVYCFDKHIPSVEKEKIGQTLPTVLHIASFAVGDGCSMKPSCGEELCRELQGFLMADGFVSGSEPLLVIQPDACNINHGVSDCGQWPQGEGKLLPGLP